MVQYCLRPRYPGNSIASGLASPASEYTEVGYNLYHQHGWRVSLTLILDFRHICAHPGMMSLFTKIWGKGPQIAPVLPL